MGKFYKVSCLIMALLTVAALVVTFFVGITGENPVDSKAGTVIILALLTVMALLTLFCLCLTQLGNGGLKMKLYKIGFYILHAGIVVLVAGFVITNLSTKKFSAVYDYETGSLVAVSEEEEKMLAMPGFPLAKGMKAKDPEIRYYPDGTPSFYEVTLYFENETEGTAISVNHPVRRDGNKIYLMSISKEYQGITLLIKYNPGEYVVICGIVTLVAGTFLMCFSDFAGKGRAGRRKDGDAAPEASEAPRMPEKHRAGKDGRK